MKVNHLFTRILMPLLALSLLAAACGDDAAEPAPAPETTVGDEAVEPAEPEPAELTPVSLQLQWFTQAQFAGYYAARDLGFYNDVGLDVTILEGGVDIVPASVLDTGAADFAVSWVPRGLVPREEGAQYHQYCPGLPAKRHVASFVRGLRDQFGERPGGTDRGQLGIRQ